MKSAVKEVSPNGTVSIEDAEQMLKEKSQEDIKNCLAEIQAALEKYSCRLDISMILKAEGNIPRLDIVKK